MLSLRMRETACPTSWWSLDERQPMTRLWLLPYLHSSPGKPAHRLPGDWKTSQNISQPRRSRGFCGIECQVAFLVLSPSSYVCVRVCRLGGGGKGEWGIMGEEVSSWWFFILALRKTTAISQQRSREKTNTVRRWATASTPGPQP